MTTELGKLIKSTREARGWSQRKMAWKIGISYQAVNGLEKGNYQAGLKVLRKIAEHFSLSFDEILDMTD